MKDVVALAKAIIDLGSLWAGGSFFFVVDFGVTVRASEAAVLLTTGVDVVFAAVVVVVAVVVAVVIGGGFRGVTVEGSGDFWTWLLTVVAVLLLTVAVLLLFPGTRFLAYGLTIVMMLYYIQAETKRQEERKGNQQ